MIRLILDSLLLEFSVEAWPTGSKPADLPLFSCAAGRDSPQRGELFSLLQTVCQVQRWLPAGTWGRCVALLSHHHHHHHHHSSEAPAGLSPVPSDPDLVLVVLISFRLGGDILQLAAATPALNQLFQPASSWEEAKPLQTCRSLTGSPHQDYQLLPVCWLAGLDIRRVEVWQIIQASVNLQDWCESGSVLIHVGGHQEANANKENNPFLVNIKDVTISTNVSRFSLWWRYCWNVLKMFKKYLHALGNHLTTFETFKH